MSLTNEINLELYRQMAELQEKLRKSEEERMKLEEKFRLLMKSCREEEEIRLKNLEDRYAKFLEDCTKRNDRNDKILRSLQKVESGANILFAKSERLKLLKSHYEAYLERVMPQWKQPTAIAYKPTYSSTIQQSPAPTSFKSSYTPRLPSSSSSDWKYPDEVVAEDTTENDRFLNFLREKPKVKNSSITFAEPVKKEPAPSFTYEKKPEVYYEVTKPVEKTLPEPVVHVIPEVEKIKIDDYIPPVETEPPKEINQEIECLSEKDETERHKRDVEYVLSDEEIQPEPYQPPPPPPPQHLESPRASPVKREISVGKLAPDITKKFEAPVTYPKSPNRTPRAIVPEEDDVSPITKKSLLEHQKSIDKLKAALSVEEEIENERKEIEEVANQPQQTPLEEETDVTESSSEVWHQPVKQEDWMQESQNVIPSDVEEIENQFAEIVNHPQEQGTYNPEEPYYQEQQENPTEIDYNEEQYPESYYEQPQTDYRPNTNLVSNVILEEDEYEEQQEETGKQEYDPNYQYPENPEYQEQYQENEQYQEGEPYQENQQFPENEQYQQQYQDNFYDENQQPVYNYDESNQQYDQNYQQPEQQQQNEYENYPQEYQQNYDEQQYQNYEENQANYPEQNYQDQQQYDPNFVQEGEYTQNYEQQEQHDQQDQQEYVEYQQEQGENYQPEQLEQENYQEEPTTVQQKQSNLAHLLESDSESYQIEHGGVTGNNEDSDFDFSLSQKQ